MRLNGDVLLIKQKQNELPLDFILGLLKDMIEGERYISVTWYPTNKSINTIKCISNVVDFFDTYETQLQELSKSRKILFTTSKEHFITFCNPFYTILANNESDYNKILERLNDNKRLPDLQTLVLPFKSSGRLQKSGIFYEDDYFLSNNSKIMKLAKLYYF